MYNIDEYVVYGNSGVCRVVSIGSLPILADQQKEYYTLSPIGSTETIYTPTDTAIYMRPLITLDKAKELLEELSIFIEHIEARCRSIAETEQDEQLLQTHNCEDLLDILKRYYAKKYFSLSHNGKKPGQRDHQHAKEAEKQFYGEIGTVLGRDPEDIKKEIDRSFDEQVEICLQHNEIS